MPIRATHQITDCELAFGHTSPLYVAEDGRSISRTGPRIHCTDEFANLLRRRKSLRCCYPLAFLEYAVDESRASRSCSNLASPGPRQRGDSGVGPVGTEFCPHFADDIVANAV